MKTTDTDEINWKKTQLSRKILYLLIRRINIIKVSTQHKVIYRFDAIPIQIPMEVFHRNRRKNKTKSIWSHKRSQIVKATLGKNKAIGIILPDFKLYWKAIVIKTVWYWHKKRPKEQITLHYRATESRAQKETDTYMIN